MQVLKGMKNKMTAKYQHTQMVNNPDFKNFGMNPEQKDQIDNQ